MSTNSRVWTTIELVSESKSLGNPHADLGIPPHARFVVCVLFSERLLIAYTRESMGANGIKQLDRIGSRISKQSTWGEI